MFKGKWKWYMMLAVLLALIFLNRELSQSVVSEDVSENEIVIIDAGHGGKDPGKIGVNDVLEKDLNLQIAKKVKENLEKQKVTVIMTREDDTAEDGKMADMKKRVALINEEKPAIAVSIHQNSYSQADIKGAQVFYYEHSEVGKNAALIMQEELKQIDSENTREAKGNDTYYLLKKTEVPTIIVECGFLSNAQEAEKLTDETYQNELANSICDGIIKWLKQRRS